MTFFENKISRVSMRDEAYELIKNAIISGELAPGTKVRDKELSEQLGISRTPVREAMLRLEDEELIISKPNSYTMIAPINLTEVKEIYSIVVALESLALRQAMVQLDEELFQQLEEVNAAYEKVLQIGDAKTSLQIDRQFHHILVQLAHNRELEKIIQKLKDKILRIEGFYFHDASPKKKSLNDHLTLIHSMRVGDVEAACTSLADNWMNSLQYILEKQQ